jgi:hypothetical protein
MKGGIMQRERERERERERGTSTWKSDRSTRWPLNLC